MGFRWPVPPGGTAWPMAFAGVWSRMGEETANVTRGVMKSRAMVFSSFAMAVCSVAPAVAQLDTTRVQGGDKAHPFRDQRPRSANLPDQLTALNLAEPDGRPIDTRSRRLQLGQANRGRDHGDRAKPTEDVFLWTALFFARYVHFPHSPESWNDPSRGFPGGERAGICGAY